jgi:hypothetical protein
MDYTPDEIISEFLTNVRFSFIKSVKISDKYGTTGGNMYSANITTNTPSHVVLLTKGPPQPQLSFTPTLEWVSIFFTKGDDSRVRDLELNTLKRFQVNTSFILGMNGDINLVEDVSTTESYKRYYKTHPFTDVDLERFDFQVHDFEDKRFSNYKIYVYGRNKNSTSSYKIPFGLALRDMNLSISKK